MWTKLVICFGLYVCVVSGSTTYYGQAGEGITLKCHYQSSEVSWKYGSISIIRVAKSGRVTKGTAFADRLKLSGSNLIISNLKSEDAGTFTCIATDRKKGQTSSDMTLQVVKVSVSVSPASPLLQSSAATLTCHADGSPDKVAWKHNNQDLTAETGKTVTLGSVKGSHDGTWQCLVYYGETPFEASLDIDVIGLKEHSNVTVKQGGDAVLPCSLSKPDLGSLRVAGGGWTQLPPAAADAPRLPSLDTSNAQELRWNSDGINTARVTISKERLHTDFGITLMKVQPSQAGQYQCSVELKDRGTLTTTVNLDVTGGGGGGSGKKPGTSNNTVSVSVSPASPLLQSSAATLTCDADGSPDKVAWKHKNNSFEGKTVTLDSVEGSHRGTWKCLVYYGETQLQASMDIDVIAYPEWSPPSWLGLNMWIWVGVAVGNMVVIVGTVVLIWSSRRKIRMRQPEIPMTFADDTTVIGLIQDGRYWQNKRNKMWTKLFFFWGLHVVVCLASESKKYYGQAGKDITLKCHGQANMFTWKHGGVHIITLDKAGRPTKGRVEIVDRIKLSGTDIIISNLKTEDKGTFTCITTDRNKRQSSSDMTLQVFKVSVSVSPASPLLQSSAATLTCHADEFGSQKKVAWKHNNKDKTDETGKTVTIDSVEGSHGGTWQCLVTYGETQFEASLGIDVIGLKEHSNVTVKQGGDAVLPCSLSKPDLGSLRVAGGGWTQLPPAAADAPRLPSLDTSNAQDLCWNADGINTARVTISEGKLHTDFGITLMKVQPSQAGQYQCSVQFKDRGTLTTTVNLQVTGGAKGGGGSFAKPKRVGSIGSPGSSPSWLGLNMWIWVGVAGGSVVLIALIVAVVLVHRNNRRRKMRTRKLRSVRKPLTANDYCQCNR
ncbi:CD4-2 molecule, tandem duplicate 2 [Sardina pilchardus]|uniref:CD4-2 molecule, tandem duplicate 2 n=1 Tax=Sardina pilchardus TaxID=27697 RepID=UPI002E0E0733